MNTSEFNNEFDLKFNNSFSGFAPGVDMFHKSLYFTEAQDDIVLEYAKIFETNEEARQVLKNIVVNASSTYNATLNTNLLTLKLNSNSKLFEIDSDVWALLTENVDGVPVKPITLDEYNKQKDNPFKKPLENTKAWRMDVSDTISPETKNIEEIIYPASITTYNYRYLKKPYPIILEELTGDETIDGNQTVTACKLNSRIHRKIIDRAVVIAIVALKENNAQNNIQV